MCDLLCQCEKFDGTHPDVNVIAGMCVHSYTTAKQHDCVCSEFNVTDTMHMDRGTITICHVHLPTECQLGYVRHH